MIFRIRFARNKIKYLWKHQKRISLTDERISNEEHMLIKLIKSKAVTPSTQILIAPLSNKRYIIDKENKLYIIMEHTSFTVISESSKLRYYLNQNVSDYLWRFVDNEVEKKRMLLEREIESMVSISLCTLLEKKGE